jgi:peptide/nickel transport system substrate-binding protein
MNADPKVGGPFANPKVQQAVRYALDYDGIMQLAGEGAQRLAGVIPNLFPGSLDPTTAITHDPDKAKSLIDEANVGKISGTLSYSSESVQFGIQSSVLAQKIQSDLMAVGMDIALDGLPNAPALEKYRGAQDQIGIWSWTADYSDASDYLVYAPGRTVGKRTGWTEDASPDAQELVELAHQAETEIDDVKRKQLYQQFGQKMNEVGPYAPLFLPAAPYGYRANIQGVTLNSVWGVDFYVVKKSG